MYEQFYGLRERPFELTPDARFLFLSPAHKEALTTLTYGMTSRKSLTAVTGEVGTGKTTLLRAALDAIGDRVSCLHLTNSALGSAEFVAFLARHFELSAGAARSIAVCQEELQQVLAERIRAGRPAVLVIDEAQSLPDEVLEDIRHLTNLETDSCTLLPIVLVGQPELWERLKAPSLRNLRQRVALRSTLRPLELRETASYVAARVSIAGGDPASVFTREAVHSIHAASQGLPRTISVLCDNALIAGLALEQKPVTAAVIHEICRDFDLPVQAADDPQTQPLPTVGRTADESEPATMAAPAVVGGPVLVTADEEDAGPADPAAATRRLPGTTSGTLFRIGRRLFPFAMGAR